MIIKKFPEDFMVEEVSELAFDDKGKYNVYRLWKKNYNTEDAINYICKRANTPRRDFKYAGSKDRNAITTQFITITRKIDNIDSVDIKLEFLGKITEPLSLGTLKGNKFEIIVREINVDELNKFSGHVKNLRLSIPNYFDEQRFSKNNLEIGLAILKKDFKRAFELIFDKECDDNDYIGRIRLTPLKTLTMFIHSVQSYVFNEALSNYIKEKYKSYTEVDYSKGKFTFPLMEEINNEELNLEFPLIGFDYDMNTNDNNYHKYINDVMQKLGIKPQDFIIRSIPELTCDTSQRNIFVAVENFVYEKIDDSTIKLKFFLSKGSYATIVVKMLFS